jgi:outer membrane protein assembly factor BamB
MRSAWLQISGQRTQWMSSSSPPIVWILGAEGDGRLHALRGNTGESIFASEPMSGLRHFQTLIAMQDRLYVGGDGGVYAFAF